MAIDKIIQSIRNNKKNHLVDFRLKSKTEDFTNTLFHILFDSEISVSQNIDALADMFKEISAMVDQEETSSFELIWKKFMVNLPGILEQLNQDAKCIYQHDPAARSVEEVILAYPGFMAIAIYRLSHEFHTHKMPLVPRIMSEYAHRLTGIEIHPGAKIGKNLFIDHGMGVVIGETSEIGNNVTIYHMATLGGIAPSINSNSQRQVKRHPTLGDCVVVGSGAQILGPVMVGANAKVGANAVVTKDVPENAVMVGIPAKNVGTASEEFKPYAVEETNSDTTS